MPKRSLWGYSPKAVRSYLNDLNERHAARRSGLQERKRLLEEEQRDLQRRLSELGAADRDMFQGESQSSRGERGDE